MDGLSVVLGVGLGLAFGRALDWFLSGPWDVCKAWLHWFRWRAYMDPPPSWVEFREEWLDAMEQERVAIMRGIEIESKSGVDENAD